MIKPDELPEAEGVKGLLKMLPLALHKFLWKDGKVNTHLFMANERVLLKSTLDTGCLYITASEAGVGLLLPNMEVGQGISLGASHSHEVEYLIEVPLLGHERIVNIYFCGLPDEAMEILRAAGLTHEESRLQ